MIDSAAKQQNRSAVAKKTKRLLRRRGWLPRLIKRSREVAQTLQDASSADLRRHTEHLRRFVQSSDEMNADSVLVLSAAGIIEAIRRSLGLNLFDVQIQAGLIVSVGAVAEMQTGEGKTLSVALPAYVRSLRGTGVHVGTPTDYLARRDHDKLTDVFGLLGVTTGLVESASTVSEKQVAYRADITYAAANNLGFDYLRDQLNFGGGDLGDGEHQRTTKRFLELAQPIQRQSKKMQRGLASVIIDEVDHVLIDDAVSPLLLSGSIDGESPDAEVHVAAMEWAERLTVEDDFGVVGNAQVKLTDVGFDRVYDSKGQDDNTRALIVHPALVRPWHEYVVAALRAKFLYQRDVHYVVRNENVQIVDASTGRVFQDRTWSDGLQQAIEAREHLQVQPETKALARITRQRFFRSYGFLGGMTGTAAGCELEFASVYGLAMQAVPPRVTSKRSRMPNMLALNKQEKWAAIAMQTLAMIDVGRSVLIGTLSIAESLEVATALESRGIAFELLNGIQDADEAALVSLAGLPRAVTVATNLAGRGTDIPLAAEVKLAGGLHVIVSQKHVLARVDRQLIGRCARCGDPGSVQTFVSADDLLVANHAPWIARAIERHCCGGSVDPPNVSKSLLRAQQRQQEIASANRKRLLESDHDVAKLWTRRSQTPAQCWQL